MKKNNGTSTETYPLSSSISLEFIHPEDVPCGCINGEVWIVTPYDKILLSKDSHLNDKQTWEMLYNDAREKRLYSPYENIGALFNQECYNLAHGIKNTTNTDPFHLFDAPQKLTTWIYNQDSNIIVEITPLYPGFCCTVDHNTFTTWMKKYRPYRKYVL